MLTNEAPGDTLIRVTKKSVGHKQLIIARTNGSTEVDAASSLPSP